MSGAWTREQVAKLKADHDAIEHLGQLLRQFRTVNSALFGDTGLNPVGFRLLADAVFAAGWRLVEPHDCGDESCVFRP